MGATAHMRRNARFFTVARLLPALLILCAIRLWVMPLFSSFWVDEMGTIFVVRHGAADASLNVAPQVPASIYYALPRASQALFGGSEAAYRLPSLAALALAMWFIARLARRLIHPAAGWFAVFACLALRDFNSQASDARPYALGICVAAASFWLLVRWLDSARWRDAAFFGVAAAFLWRIHLIFWPVYAVYALYAASRLASRPIATRVSWKSAALIFAAIATALAPVAKQALAINQHAAAHVVVPQPSLGDLTTSLKFAFVMSFCGVSALLSRWLHWPAAGRMPSGPAWTLIFGWWVIPGAALFVFSHVTQHSVFVGRYLSVAMPGAGLAATAAAAAFIPAGYYARLSAALGVLVLLFAGGWGRALPLHHNSDWRGAARELNREADRNVPVVCPSPFVEAQPPVWHPGYPLDSFLYSNLLAYPIRGRELPFPYETSWQAERYAALLSAQSLVPSGRFFVYGGKGTVEFWIAWFRARPEFASWVSHPLGSFGDVAVVAFESPAIIGRGETPLPNAIRRF